MARLGDVCQKATSNIAQKDLENRNGEYEIYGASGFIKKVDFYQQENPYIAVVKDGAGIGRVMKLPAKTSVIGTMQYIIPNNDIDISYLAYAMENMNLAKYYTGATIPHIYFKDYQKEELPVPSLEEQRKIAAVLDKVSDLIAKRRQQLEKLDLLVKARFVEMFGDIDILNVNWHSEHFKDITVCFDSFRKPVKASDRKLMQGQYPYYGATGIVDYVNDYKLDGEYLLISEDGKSLEFRNKPIAFIAKGKIWVNNHAHVVQCKEKANITYLMFHINYMDISRW
uniref:restriction endonuclease subunit S n=1 Tax=Anaerotignum lactatifermentans TaxID=160404 RepID=UPI0030791D2E